MCSLCRNVLKWRHPSLSCELRSGIIFSVINSIFLFHVIHIKYMGEIILLIIRTPVQIFILCI
jgi:hypothetical protein